MKRLFFSLFFALFSFAFADARDGFLLDYVSRNWTSADGLPGNTITAVMQDDTGYLWFGTYEGLVRYDGMEFITMNRSVDEKYPFISVRSLYQDTRGAIWVGSNDEGATKIEQNGEISVFNTENGLPSNSIRAIYEDKEGNIWLGTTGGPAFISADSKINIPEGLEEFGEENPVIHELYCDNAGKMWLCTGKENALYVYSNKKFTKYSGITKIQNPRVNFVIQDYQGNFWFGIEPHYAVKISSDGEELFELGSGSQKGTMVSKIYEDINRNLWFALDNGVTILHEGKFSFLEKSSGLADEKVAALIQDREGNMWLGTDRAGIQKMSLSRFRSMPIPTTINAICPDYSRELTWLGGDNGLYCTNGSDLIQNEITEFCKDVRIRHVGMTRSGGLLVSTYEKLGQILIERNGKIRQWTHENGLVGDKVRVALESKSGNLFVGTTTGLSIIDQKSGEILRNLTKADGLPNEFIMALFEDKNGKMWIGTDGGGIFSYSNGEIGDFYKSADGLAGNVIFKICEIDGKMWICTGTGISVVGENPDGTFKFGNILGKNGLGTDGIFQAIPDSLGNVWLTSNHGICKAGIEELENIAFGKSKKAAARYFGKNDGLNSRGVTSNSLSVADSLGRIWFTLIDGIAVYDPVKSMLNKVPAPVQIQEITVDSEKIEWRGGKIVLEPGTKRLRIKYTGISFSAAEQMLFCSKLEGFDQDYTDWTFDRIVTYTNLPHGKYKFTVTADNGEGVLSYAENPLEVVKKPFIWELVWFWILVAILTLGTAAAIVAYRIRAMKRYEIELEAKVVERTHELQLEKERSESLLLNILPQDIAEELTNEPGKSISKKYPKATVLFTDIVGFTKMSSGMSADSVVRMLNSLFSKFDVRAQREGIEKIKTIGDSYMAAAGLIESEENDGAQKIIRYANGILSDLEEFNRTAPVKINIRIGIHTGNLVAGVIGRTKFIYDIWGDTVNTASRMESSGMPLRIHTSQRTYEETKSLFKFSEPVEVEVKGKGLMKTYYIE